MPLPVSRCHQLRVVKMTLTRVLNHIVFTFLKQPDTEPGYAPYKSLLIANYADANLTDISTEIAV